MLNLYLVNLTYKESDVGEDEGSKIHDTWTLAGRDNEDIHKIMDINAKAFEGIGYKLLKYSFTQLSVTDNGYRIILEQ